MAYIKPNLVYIIPVWSPNLKLYNDLIKVQQREIMTIPKTRELSYREKIVTMNLSMLEARRKRGDIITTFKFPN